jgi:hypothetical protein
MSKYEDNSMTKKLIRGGLVVDGTGKRSSAVLRKKGIEVSK